jgi:glucose-6-phosphate-specific signal transduction histidine kinase
MPLMVPPSPGAAPDNDRHDQQGVGARSLLRRALSSQEQERHAVARVLHNEIGQAVSAIKMSAHLALDESDAAQRRQDLQEIIRIADDTVGRLRELSTQLRPPQLSDLGLEAALRGEIEQLAGTASIPLRLEPLAQEPDEETALACFRTAQQALAHALRHAPGSRIQLVLADDGEDQFSLSLIDEGDAFAPSKEAPGFDLSLLHERACALGGQLQTGTSGDGTRLCLRLPYRAVDHASVGLQPPGARSGSSFA